MLSSHLEALVRMRLSVAVEYVADSQGPIISQRKFPAQLPSTTLNR